VVIHRRVPYRSNTAITVPLDAVAQKAFRYGENTFEVRSHKHATAHKCNTGRTSQLGVEFVLTGRIATDLVAGIQQSVVEYRKLAPNQTYTQGFNVTFGNDGPAWLPMGTFRIDVCCPQAFSVADANSIGVAPPGPPLTNCMTSANSGQDYTVDCGLKDFAPGTSGALGSIFRVMGPPIDYGDFSLTITWQLGPRSFGELQPSNNQAQTKFVFCGTKSTNPGCQSTT
jgi:hypothetical protein